MQLNDKQLQILKAIHEGHTSDEELHKVLGFQISLISHYLEELEKASYLKAAHGWLDGRYAFLSCWLTPKGKVAVENPEDLMQPNSTIPMTNNISISGSVDAPITILQDADSNTVTINQNIDQNVAEIIKSLEKLKQDIKNLPADEKEDAEDFLNYIQEEIEKPSKQRDESKIAKNFKRFCKIAVPFLLSGIINSADFTNNVTDLATKFNVDLPQLPMIQ